MNPIGSPIGGEESRQNMAAVTQSRYERSFKSELEKLQGAIDNDRKLTAELKALQTLCDGFVEACNLNALTSIYILYDP